MTVPSAPRYVLISTESHRVSLSWSPPATGGGRPVTGYIIYIGESPDAMTFSITLDDLTRYTLNDLPNGVTYYIKISAVNEAGEGPPCTTVTATPMGLPGAPRGLTATVGLDSIEILWSPPLDTGGSDSLTYHVLRGTATDSLEPLEDLADVYTYTDSDVEKYVTYYYGIRSENEVGLGPLAYVNATIVTAPESVIDLVATPGDNHVHLTWSPPGMDGGKPITGYVVLRGPSASDLNMLVELGTETAFNDSTATNGQTYFYSVRATNIVGSSEPPPALSATPLGPPGQPMDLVVKVVEDHIELSWTEPSSYGTVDVTGYRVLRGTSPGLFEPLADVGLELSYKDSSAQEGRTYYYRVVALSDLGPGEATASIEVTIDEGAAFPWWIVVLVVVAIVGAVVLVIARGRGEDIVALAEAPPADVVVDVDAAETPMPAVAGTAREGPTYLVEQVFMVYGDGRLILDCARDECRTQDADLMSGMLIAIQGIVQDGLTRGGQLESIKYGENIILMASGESINLAVVIYGRPDDALRTEIESLVQFIEKTYADVIEDWTGDLSLMADAKDLIAPLLETTANLTRREIKGVTRARGVTLLSAADFHRGFVRLKVVAENNTEETVSDSTIEVHYDPDMLRLDGVEPSTLSIKGDRVLLGNLRPGDERAVAFLFDPQMCQGTHIDGTLSYYDTSGDYRHVDMKRRHAEVVCPIFFTKENANTAMLRRLVKETLHQSDHRVFVYPRTMPPEEAFKIGKLALGTGDFQQVREFVEGGPPFEAEVWYYGETKVKRYQMVMRVGVVQEERALELFVASTAMEPVTGLMAEFKRTLDRILHDEYPEGTEMEHSRDEVIKKSLEDRELLIEIDGWKEDTTP
jgi:fibronectin type 3 domain-containing protein